MGRHGGNVKKMVLCNQRFGRERLISKSVGWKRGEKYEEREAFLENAFLVTFKFSATSERISQHHQKIWPIPYLADRIF